MIQRLIGFLAAVMTAALPALAADAPWEKEVAAIEARWQQAAPADGGVVFAGSSSVRLWDLAAAFPDWHPVNAGFGGSRIADCARFAPRLIHRWHPQTVVFYAGDNDLAGGLSPDEVVRDFQEFATALHAALPDCRLIFLSIKPSASRWHLWPRAEEANARIRILCEAVGEPRLRFVDVATPLLAADGHPDPQLFLDDRLHLNAAGYRRWQAVLAPVLSDAP